MSTPDQPESPAAAYRRIASGIDEAVGAVRRQDELRATRLEQALAKIDARMRRVGERAALTRFSVELHWESALEALWAEPWMTVRPFPRPDPDAEPARLEGYEREVDRTYTELMDLVARRRFGFRR
ncbi:hypothetical protein GCM10010472_63530 [Pseudonocardia halophobica]|uniref:Uncharacterized protein n=1 Tax=Pseudonocardia halophobica TaxID=29401 RepID=A0A9W6UFT6_9PSEU|nr:hypothetical protein [Pseudonocardia halophobica]GLL15622.1 hypothetical protein GCM10017577_67740 [Pseudonocardia halophobica]